MRPPFQAPDTDYDLWNYSADHNNIEHHVQSPTKSLTKSEPKTPEAVFGQVLKEVRQRAGLTQEELAFESGYHPTYIGQLERGKKNPTLKALLSFARVLKISAARLVEMVEDRT